MTSEPPASSKNIARADTACVEGLKLLVAHDKLTMTNKSRSWQALRQSVSNHVVRTERDDPDETSKGKFTDLVSANIDMSGVFTLCRHVH